MPLKPMDRMRRRACGLAGLALLCGCAQPAPQAAAPPPAADSKTADATSPAQPATCKIQMLGHSVHPGEDGQFAFTVKQNSLWCFDGITLSNGVAGNAISNPPAHGTLRLVPNPGAMVFGYRPAPGYVGSDQFRISVPGNYGGVYFAGHVTVEP